ncbi:MAG: hypothetical protein SCG73_07320 [Nitrospiraceae bacterium]|jgi:hypothetical protein|nr:hypothetical protein [Nitrospira sp.]MDW7649407.1 hypothetical protein [Nitrospiraceae bacterium]GBL39870.1 hypothetical protein EMGBD2_11280 [Nitrospirota bacterium]MBP0122206.1 hypothetical protein [Nitrospira sp.]MBP0124013.1 hypothetical protein [Nitrospira sp.]
MKTRSILAIFFALALIGCAEGAKLVQERADGGVVIYPFKGEQGAILASSRKDAIALMQEKCGGLYNIVREGEAKGRTRMAGHVEGAQEIIQERRWGIEFRCK